MTEYSTASDFIDRAIFSYERAFVGVFNFMGGCHRLDFDHVENRPFFLALHRQLVWVMIVFVSLLRNLTIVSDLHRRGCTRTAFEFAKLLYSLDPWTDPHGSLLHLDGLALKAGMHEWLLDVWEYFETDKDGLEGRLTPNVLPGWWYTRALAMKIREDTTTLHVSEVAYLFIEPFTPIGTLGPYIEYPGVCSCSIPFSFSSPITRGQVGCATICGGPIQSCVQITC